MSKAAKIRDLIDAGLTHLEIAEQLDVTVQTIGVVCWHARRKRSKQLQPT